MVHTHQPVPAGEKLEKQIQVIRHSQVCKKLQVSSAKLFDMVAKGQFPKPFLIIPGGRAVGWLESTVDGWILERKETQREIAACAPNPIANTSGRLPMFNHAVTKLVNYSPILWDL